MLFRYGSAALHGLSETSAGCGGYFQTVFLKYALSDKTFESEEHEKGMAHPRDSQRLQGFAEESLSQMYGAFGRGGGLRDGDGGGTVPRAAGGACR